MRCSGPKAQSPGTSLEATKVIHPQSQASRIPRRRLPRLHPLAIPNFRPLSSSPLPTARIRARKQSNCLSYRLALSASSHVPTRLYLKANRRTFTPAELLRTEAVVTPPPGRKNSTLSRPISSLRHDHLLCSTMSPSGPPLRKCFRCVPAGWRCLRATRRVLYDPRRRAMTREYRWSKEQAEELMGSVARHGARWSLISRDVGRTAPACQSKWHRVREGTERGMGKDDELEPLWEGAQSFPKQWPLVASLVGTRPELSAITRNGPSVPPVPTFHLPKLLFDIRKFYLKYQAIYSRQNQDLDSA